MMNENTNPNTNAPVDANVNNDSAEFAAFKKNQKVKETIEALRADPAVAVLLGMGLEKELNENPDVALTPVARNILIRDYSKKALEAEKSKQAAPADLDPRVTRKPANPDVNTSTEQTDNGYSPAEKSVDDLMKIGYTREQAVFARAFPPREPQFN